MMAHLPTLTSTKPQLPPEPIGWPLLPVPDAEGALHYPSLEQSLREQIIVILRTAQGAQLMRPEFGAGLETLLHEPNTLAARARLRERIIDGLKAFEPRIAVERVDVDPAADSREVRATIAYRVARTGAAQALAVRVPLGGV
jgi:uncharacterized protein